MSRRQELPEPPDEQHALPAELEREKEARAVAELAWRRAFFLSEAGHALASSLDYTTTLGTLARLAVPYLADWCAVDLVENVGLRRVAAYHADPVKLEVTRRLQEHCPPEREDASWAGDVLRSGKSQLLEEVGADLLQSIAGDAEHLELLLSLGMSSAMLVPLLARQKTLGVLSLVSGGTGRRFGARELALAEELARRAALALDNACLYEQALRERDRAQAQIQHQAYHDHLTGLPNSMLFRDRLELGIAHAQRNGKRLAVMYSDLDHFKWINDTLGHATGDRLLKAVAERMRGCLRDDDTVARLGGDEFTLLLPELNSAEDAAKIARKLVESVARPFEIDGAPVRVSMSMGVSIYPDDGSEAEALVQGADNALHRAKETGRSNVQLCTAALNARAHVRMELEKALHTAVERGELLLHYQPLFESRTRRLLGAEALLRWNHPQAGLLYPDDFVSLAEDSRLIGPIGDWALRTACSQAREWQSRSGDLSIAVNLSGRQFEGSGFADSVDAALSESGLDPRRLELEITESVALREADAARSLLGKLRSRGVRVAIDDFGTGHSSLQALRRLPVDALKIDRGFVRDLSQGRDGQAIVRAIIAMAHSLRLQVVAEGVETESQLRFLEGERCEQLQGFLLGRPVPAEQFEQLLDAKSARATAHAH